MFQEMIDQTRKLFSSLGTIEQRQMSRITKQFPEQGVYVLYEWQRYQSR